MDITAYEIELYLPDCQICNWVDDKRYGLESAQKRATDHVRSAHPKVMKLIDETKMLKDMVDIAFELITGPNDFVHYGGESYGDFDDYCDGCDFNAGRSRHQADCSVAKFLALRESWEGSHAR